MQAKLRSKKLDIGQVKEAEKTLDRVAAQVALGGALEPLIGARDAASAAPEQPVVASALKKGARVFVPRIRAEADVLELLADGQVRVQAGPMKLTVAAADLRMPNAAVEAPPAPAKSERRDERKPTRPSAWEANRRPAAGAGSSSGLQVAASSADPPGLEVAVQTSDNSSDLRGMRTDDALSMAVSFLDRALNENVRVVFLIHGHGTGALKEAIRRELKSSPYVRYFRAGTTGEGGDGVTIAWLS